MKKRLTGVDISIPFIGGGASWDYIKTSKELWQELFTFLESKRILVNPKDMENDSWCRESAIEIKNTLATANNQSVFNSDNGDLLSLNAMIDICNKFLDDLEGHHFPHIIYKSGNDWENPAFGKAMKNFRYAFRDEIKKIEQKHSLSFRKHIPDEF